MYALSVMLTIDPAHVEDFKAAALRHAANTKTNENIDGKLRQLGARIERVEES